MSDTDGEGEVNAVESETPDTGQADETETTTEEQGYTAEELLAAWNQSKDRELSQLHRQYQGQMAQMKHQSVARMKQLGDEDADKWASSNDILDKARAFDAFQNQQQAWQTWYRHVAETANAHGLAPNDPRLQNAQNSNELMTAARNAMRENARAEASQEQEAVRAERKAQMGVKVKDGQYDTMGGSPASNDSMAEWKAAIANIQRGDVHTYSALQREFRARGLDV